MFKVLKKLEDVVKNNENKIAYSENKTCITYKELWDKSNKLASSLKREGTSPVLIYGDKSTNMLISIVACLIANRTYIPIDICFPIERVKTIIELSKSTLVIANESLLINGINCMSISDINQNFKDNEEYDTSLNKIAYIIFTSGSTGTPKGVPVLYENLENFIDWILATIPNCGITKVLNQASFSFDLSVADLYYSLLTASTLVALSRVVQNDYSLVLNTIQEENINLIVTTPTFLKLLMLDAEFSEDFFKELKCVYLCGEQFEVITAQKLLKRFPNIKIINAYGPTEATSAVSSIFIKPEMFDKNFLPVGEISKSAVNIEILDDEIVLKGKSVFSGYLNYKSENCFLENGANCYKTGDIGKIENDLLYCYGRKDEQLKYKGYRIELGDIENNLLKIEGVNEAVATLCYKKDTNIIRGIRAFVTVSNGISGVWIQQELKKLLPSYMIPQKIIVLDKIPINSNGKYDRKKLKDYD